LHRAAEQSHERALSPLDFQPAAQDRAGYSIYVTTEGFSVRRATEADADGIVAIWQVIAAERSYSAIDQPWTVEQERRYLFSLSPREAIHVAVSSSGHIVGFQSLDPWAPAIHSMRHVAQLGTFLLPE